MGEGRKDYVERYSHDILAKKLAMLTSNVLPHIRLWYLSLSIMCWFSGVTLAFVSERFVRKDRLAFF